MIRPETSIAEACANLDPCVALAALVKALNEAADELEFEHHDAYHAQQLRKLAAIGTQP